MNRPKKYKAKRARKTRITFVQKIFIIKKFFLLSIFSILILVISWQVGVFFNFLYEINFIQNHVPQRVTEHEPSNLGRESNTTYISLQANLLDFSVPYFNYNQYQYEQYDDKGIVNNTHELINELNEFMKTFGYNISVFYENLETGFKFSHNGDTVYFGASATKAPFAFYIFYKIHNGETNLNYIFSFTYEDFWEGSGVIRHNYSVGESFTQQRLLYLMLSPSDNIATRILRRVHGLNGFREFVYSVGANPGFVQNLTYSYISANEAGIFMREIYSFINSSLTYGDIFKNMLLSNRYPFIRSSYPIASKSGWAANFGGAFHDMGIVFAPSPYILIILSNKNGNYSDMVIYNNISMFIEDFNRRNFDIAY